MASEASKTPPNNIKSLLKERKLTQVALASKVGVDRGVVGRIIRGQQLPTRDEALWIAKALDTSEDQVFPDGSFRDDVTQKKRDAATAERILALESKAADLLAKNDNLSHLQDEIVAQFSAKLSSIHEDKIKLEQELADERNKNKKLSAQNFGAQFTVYRRDAEIRSLKKKIASLEENASTLRGLAVAGGSAAVVMGALAALSDR